MKKLAIGIATYIAMFIICLVAPSVTEASSTRDSFLEIKPGWNLIAGPEAEVSASQWVDYLNQQNLDVTAVAVLRNGHWKIHLPGFDFNDYEIDQYDGVMVYSGVGGFINAAAWHEPHLPCPTPKPTVVTVTPTPTPTLTSTPTPTPTPTPVPTCTSQVQLTRNDGYGSTEAHAETIVKGASDVRLMRFTVNNTNCGDITWTNLNLSARGPAGYVGQHLNTEDNLVTNVTIYVDGVEVGTPEDLHEAQYALGLVVPSGGSIEVDIRGKLSPSITAQYLQIGVDGATFYDGSGDTVEGFGLIDGGIIELVETGTLVVQTDPNTPNGQYLIGGTNDNLVHEVKFRAVDDVIRLDQLRFYAVDQTGSRLTGPEAQRFADNVRVSLLDGNGNLLDSESPRFNQVGEAFVEFDLGSTGPVIPKDSQDTVMVRVDLNPITEVVDSGTLIRFQLDPTRLEAVSYSTSSTLQTADIVWPQGDVMSDLFVGVKSQPTVSILPTSQQAFSDLIVYGSDRELLRFEVAADQAGDISVAQIAFELSVNGLDVSGQLSLYEVKNGTVDRRVVLGTSLPVSINSGSSAIETIDFFQHEQISAGSSKVYALFADSVADDGNGQDGDTLSISLPGDWGVPHIGPSLASPLASAYFVWSDHSDPFHTDSTDDFYNGTLVSGLPTVFFTRFM